MTLKKVQHEPQKSTWGINWLTSQLWIGNQKGRNVATFATPPPKLALLWKAIEWRLQLASRGNSRVEPSKGRQGGFRLWKPQGGFFCTRAPHLTCQQQCGAWFCRPFPSQKDAQNPRHPICSPQHPRTEHHQQHRMDSPLDATDPRPELQMVGIGNLHQQLHT